MSQKQILILLLLVAAVYWWANQTDGVSVPEPEPRVPAPQPKPEPKPTPQPDPKPKPRRPWDTISNAPVGAMVGGAKHTDGTAIACELPAELHRRNVASRGLGCCVFRSIDHAANWQNVPSLDRFPEWMISKGIEGGGYPSKVADLIPKIARDRGASPPDYIQVEGMDIEVLKHACRTGRMPCVTYSVSPTGRYNGQRIAHMVNLVHADDRHFVVLDNNYVGPNSYEWMTPEEFRRSYSPGWAVILLSPPPPPPPKNRKGRNDDSYPEF